MAVQPAQQQPVMTRRLFTVDEYYRMAEVGILADDERVELIRGEIVRMNPIGSAHNGTVATLDELLREALGRRAFVITQGPLRLVTESEPEPDVLVLRRRDDNYRRAHPMPADVLFVIEVAESSLDYDREVKGPLFAEAGIIEYWIVDLTHQAIEVYRDPSPDGYRSVHVAQRGDVIHPLAFLNAEVAVASVLG